MEPGEFQSLLNRLRDENHVEAAQQEYQTILENDVGHVIQLHYIVLEQNQDKYILKFSATLLSNIFRVITDEELAELSPFINNLIQTRTILLFQNEQYSVDLMEIISYLAACIAAKFMRHNAMLNFIPSLLVIAKSLHPVLAPASLNCIDQICSAIPYNLEKESDELVQIIIAGIQQEVSESFFLYGLNLLYTIIMQLHPRINLSGYSGIFTPALTELSETLSMHRALQRLSSFVQRRGTFFGENLPHLINLLSSIITNHEQQNGNRIISMEIIVYIAKANGATFIQYLETVLTALLTAVDANIDEDYIENVEASDNSLLDSIDTTFQGLVQIFGQKTQFPSLSVRCISDALNSEEWQYKRSGLAFLEKLINVFHKSLENELEAIATIIFNHITDESPAVRSAAYNTFAEASASFSPDLENNYHENVMELLTAAIANEPFQATKSSAIIALSRFCENCTTEILERYSQDLMGRLVEIVNDQEPPQQILIMKCVSYLSENTQESFTQYYPFFISWLKEIIAENSPTTLRAMAIQNYPIIGEAIDKETFIPDAEGLLNTILEEDWSQMCDEEFDAVQSAIREIAYYIPDFFSSYVPRVLEILLDIISQDLKPFRTDAHGEPSVCEVLSTHNPDITYDRQFMKTIKEAVMTVSAILEENPEETLQFSQNIGDMCYKICTYSFFPQVQTAAVGCFIRLLDNFIREQSDGIIDFATRLQSTVVQLVATDQDPNVTIIMLELLIDTIDALTQCNYNCSPIVPHVVDICTMHYQLSLQRRLNYNESETCNGENAKEYLHEDDLIFSLGLAVRCCFRNFPEETFKYVGALSKINDPIFQLMLRTDDACVRNVSAQELSQLVALIFENASVNRMNVIRVAYICFANLVNYNKVTLPDQLQSITNAAIGLIRHFVDAEDETALLAIDGACVALAAIFRLQEAVNTEMLQTWFDQLPLEKTMEESEIVILFLIERVEQFDQTIINIENMERLLTVLSTASIDPKLSTTMREKAALCVKQLSRADEVKEMFEIAHASLDTEKRIAVNRCLEWEES